MFCDNPDLNSYRFDIIKSNEITEKKATFLGFRKNKVSYRLIY
jgi:hypothetical protein